MAGHFGANGALDTKDMIASLDKLFALDITTHKGLEQDCRLLLAKDASLFLRLEPASKALKFDGSTTDNLVSLFADEAAHVLLDQGRIGIQFLCTQLLHVSKESSTEKDLGESDLVLVCLLDGCLQDSRTHLLSVKAPMFRVDKHIVALYKLGEGPA